VALPIPEPAPVITTDFIRVPHNQSYLRLLL
jgi:hypothetical protein